VLLEWNIQRKVGKIVTDDGSSIVKAIRDNDESVNTASRDIQNKG
jgi:hypothetical protein